jgi:hypothetical protein
MSLRDSLVKRQEAIGRRIVALEGTDQDSPEIVIGGTGTRVAYVHKITSLYAELAWIETRLIGIAETEAAIDGPWEQVSQVV